MQVELVFSSGAAIGFLLSNFLQLSILSTK